MTAALDRTRWRPERLLQPRPPLHIDSFRKLRSTSNFDCQVGLQCHCDCRPREPGDKFPKCGVDDAATAGSVSKIIALSGECMPLDPQAQALLDVLNVGTPVDPERLEPEALRRLFRGLRPPQALADVAKIEDLSAPGPGGEIRLRAYTPHADAPYPALLYFHGGGFVLGELDDYDAACTAFANRIGCKVFSVDYRLAPEHPFPAAAEDCYAATRWAATQGHLLGIDAGRIAVAGDSAGGNLAAVVCLLCRERGGPALAHQLLVYPVLNYAFDTRSYQENAEGYMLTRNMMKWFWSHYLTDPDQGRSQMASPLQANDLSELAPATIFSAEYDPLRDEAEAYAERLRADGVSVDLTRFQGVFHGFFALPGQIDKAQEAMTRASQALHAAFAYAGPTR